MRLIVLIGFLLITSPLLHAQEVEQTDTVKVEKLSKRQLKIRSKTYNPRTASKRSALIPGWGQIYNDSWWKVPVIYTSFGVSLYFVYYNDSQFHEAKTLLAEERAGNMDANRIRVFSRVADSWRRNRDLVVLTMAGIYALQIIDATVDANLKGFNVDEDLALNLKPKFGVISNGAPYLGVGITLPIGK